MYLGAQHKKGEVQDEVRATTDDWSALGMHGNQSGPLMVEGKFNLERMIGPAGDGKTSMEECVDPYFLFLTSSCWNGIGLGTLDIARRHLTTSTHADIGMHVSDYPTIQDYFGESLIDVNTSRCMAFLLAQTLDACTNNNDWSIHADLSLTPRAIHLFWLWQLKFTAAKTVGTVTETMLKACGGTGYKTDLGLERLYRDSKAGWVMAPSNEVLRNLVGLSALTGFTSIDLWEENINERVVQREVRKMSAEQKEAMGKRLLEEAARENCEGAGKHPYQDTDFLNPFNTAPPALPPKEVKTGDGVLHQAALNPDSWTPLTLTGRSDVNTKMSAFTFALPNPSDHTGCLPGQYIAVRVSVAGKDHVRYLSPVSRPDDYGRLEVVLRYETCGVISTFFKELALGKKVEFQGPCGGFEYEANELDELTILVAGAGITPGMQLVRSLTHNPKDLTRFTLLYYSDSLQDILHHAELDSLAGERVRVVHTLGEAPEGWTGEEGYIDIKKIDQYVTKPKNGMKNKVLICGGPTMSIACLFALQKLGFPSKSIYIYGQFGVEQVKAVYGKSAALSGHNCHDLL